MSNLLRGTLVEYGEGLIGPIPNVVIFQFNPETLTRNLHIPERPTGANTRETTQAGEKTSETISLTARFSAADELGDNKVLARTFGVGPRLCALEKMVHPSDLIGGALGAALDAIGGALGLGGGGQDDPAQPIPRAKYPKIIFIWGLTRVLPVTISSMRITEAQYDFLLNPTQADVEIEMTVNESDLCSTDAFAKGALTYTTVAKEAQAIANLANTAEQIVELIPL
jgi:hypothetical protein